MRIWDLPVYLLCNGHLKAEHAELHCMWSVIVNDKDGYATHPETMRWRSCLRAMYRRHQQQVVEMIKRGMQHKSKLEIRCVAGSATQTKVINTISDQIRLLRQKREEGKCSSPSCIERIEVASYGKNICAD